MKVGPLEVAFHRTVRVADGRSPSNLPPSLGRAKLTPVAEFKDACPESWEESGYFIPLHDKEALWMSFHAGFPVAILVGAGGINALTGERLGTVLTAGGYMVAPPQPWLDGFKAEDGTVYQFVATPFKAGAGLSVGEQILGAESKTGGIGIAVFESKAPLAAASSYGTGHTDSPFGSDFIYPSYGGGAKGMSMAATLDAAPKMRGGGSMRSAEMGVGRGGAITQKIYPDPHGIEVWKDAPAATMAIYLVNAEAYREITGTAIPLPVGAEDYKGPWFGQDDAKANDVQGAPVFAGLKSVFSGDTSNSPAAATAETDQE